MEIVSCDPLDLFHLRACRPRLIGTAVGDVRPTQDRNPILLPVPPTPRYEWTNITRHLPLLALEGTCTTPERTPRSECRSYSRRLTVAGLEDRRSPKETRKVLRTMRRFHGSEAPSRLQGRKRRRDTRNSDRGSLHHALVPRHGSVHAGRQAPERPNREP